MAHATVSTGADIHNEWNAINIMRIERTNKTYRPDSYKPAHMLTHTVVNLHVQRNTTLKVRQLLGNHLLVALGWRITLGVLPDATSESLIISHHAAYQINQGC